MFRDYKLEFRVLIKFMTKKPIILLIEPDEFLADIYEKNLTMNGFKVVSSKTGEKGFVLAQTKEPKLILLEVALGKENGFDVLARIKGNKTTKNIPVIIITKLGQKKDVQKGLELGALDYIIKIHFSPSELVDKVKRVLAGN